MDQDEYTNWAKNTWGHNRFVTWTVVREESTVILRKLAENPIVKTLEWNGGWQERPAVVVSDTVVPSIQWITLTALYPTLAEVHQHGRKPAHLLVIPKASVVLDEKAYIQTTQPERHYKLMERIKCLASCGEREARKLAKLSSGHTRLQAIEFAAYLLNQFAHKGAATEAVEQLWSYTPEQICSAIPPRFHALATASNHAKAKADIQRCIDYMASWWLGR